MNKRRYVRGKDRGVTRKGILSLLTKPRSQRMTLCIRISGKAQVNGSAVPLYSVVPAYHLTTATSKHLFYVLSIAMLRTRPTASEKERMLRQRVRGAPLKSDLLSNKTPVTCNTGVTKPLQKRLLAAQVLNKQPMEKITKHVDWISATFPVGTEPQQVFPSLEFKHTGRGIHGYERRLQNGDTGAQFFTDGHDGSMGVHMQLSGSTLSAMRKAWNISDDGLTTHIADLNGKIGRIDLAINIHGGKITPDTFFEAVRDGTAKTSARKSSYVWGVDDGIEAMTTYIGNRQSDRFMRVYDKNAELKNKDVDAWIRFELELKRVWANGAQKAMTQHSTDAVINSHFQDFLQWPNREYNRAVHGESAPIDEIGRTETNTEKWLLQQVVPALARVTYANQGFLAKFMIAFRKARRELASGQDS